MGHDPTGDFPRPDEPRGTTGKTAPRRGRHAAPAARAGASRRRDRMPLVAIGAALVAAVAVIPLLGSGSGDDEPAGGPAGGSAGRTPAMTTPAPTGWGETNGGDPEPKAESAPPAVGSASPSPAPSATSPRRPEGTSSPSSPTGRPRRGRCKDGDRCPPWLRD